MRAWPVRLAALLAAVLLGACAPLPSQDAAAPLGPPLDRFVAEGRISLKQAERRDHLRFRWEHSPEADSLLLMSPLGQGLAELSRDAGGARLAQPNRPPLAAPDLRQLSQDVFGTALPFEALVDWLRGARPERGGLVDGWRVEVSETSPHRQRLLLRVLEARREDVELKLIVDQWDDGESND